MLGLNKKMSDEVKSAQQPKGHKEIIYHRKLGKFFISYPGRAGWFPCTATRLEPFAKRLGLRLETTKRPRAATIYMNGTRSISVNHPKGGNMQEAAEILLSLLTLSNERPKKEKGEKTRPLSPKQAYIKRLGL